VGKLVGKDVDGVEVGEADGCTVEGKGEGAPVGGTEGACEGKGVGPVVGTVEGSDVGAWEG